MLCRFPWEALPHLSGDGGVYGGGGKVGKGTEGDDGGETVVGM